MAPTPRLRVLGVSLFFFMVEVFLKNYFRRRDNPGYSGQHQHFHNGQRYHHTDQHIQAPTSTHCQDPSADSDDASPEDPTQELEGSCSCDDDDDFACVSFQVALCQSVPVVEFLIEIFFFRAREYVYDDLD